MFERTHHPLSWWQRRNSSAVAVWNTQATILGTCSHYLRLLPQTSIHLPLIRDSPDSNTQTQTVYHLRRRQDVDNGNTIAVAWGAGGPNSNRRVQLGRAHELSFDWLPVWHALKESKSIDLHGTYVYWETRGGFALSYIWTDHLHRGFSNFTAVPSFCWSFTQHHHSIEKKV